MDLNQYRLTSEPFHCPTADERAVFSAAVASQLPIMLKGPTGCGKTRFVEYMAWQLARPLITVACHEDMTAADLVGRYLLTAEGTVWADGPLTMAVRHGAICYLDEVVEARQDTTVVIHPLADTRRVLPLERKGELVPAHPDFVLVVSYNPGYQSAVKDLKESTKPALPGARLRLSRARRGSRDRDARSRDRPRDGEPPGGVRRENPAPARARLGRRRVHPHDRACRRD